MRISWFRKGINSKSTWSKLHNSKVSQYAFDPVKSNFDLLNKAKTKCKNPFWKELYSSLITCQLNVLHDFPEEYRYIPINGEPYITENNVSIMQDWSMYKNLDEIPDASGCFRELGNISGDKRPLTFEFNKLKKTLTDFVGIYSGRRLRANNSRLARSNRNGEGYNIYGRLITKKKKRMFWLI